MGLFFNTEEQKTIDKIENIQNIINEMSTSTNLLDEKIKLLERKRLSFQREHEDKLKIINREKETSLKLITQEKENIIRLIDNEREAVEKIYLEAKIGNTLWLSNLISDYYIEGKLNNLKFLTKKDHPIQPSTANEFKKLIKSELKQLKIENKELKYLLDRYETEVPELVGENVGDIISEVDDFEDEVNEKYKNISYDKYKFLTKEDYLKLEPSEKNQLELDRYWTKRKNKAVIGRDYERYIGYLYEMKGYDVTYYGIKHGKEDLGIDLICKKGKNEVLIIQCKYWKKEVNIRENTISQLFGTFTKYKINHTRNEERNLFNDTTYKALLYTSTTLSETAKDFANILNIEVFEKIPLENYPIIKCNISSDGSRIYHLPYDQQYDRTIINQKQGEFYAKMIIDAENKGFRRAWRWFGD